MKIGDRVYVHGYVDEIRKDTVIIRNEGGYFGTVKSEIVEAQKTEDIVSVIRCKDCKHRIKWKESYGCSFWGYYGDEFADGEMFCYKGERKDDETD